MSSNPYVTGETKNWPDLVAGLFEMLTGREAEITYEFDELQVGVPSRTGPAAERAHWTLNGRLVIRTSRGSAA
jgi:hypothetical protein